jgi:hypothetical protein
MSETQAIALSIPTFCRTYGIGRSKTYELIGAGTLEAKKFGSKTLIDCISAEAWYRGLPDFSPAQRIVKMRATVQRRSQIGPDGPSASHEGHRQ